MDNPGEESWRDHDLYDDSPCGYVLTDETGRILRTNATFRRMARLDEEVPHVKFQDLFTAGARIYYQTHLRPLLDMQGAVREVALDLLRDGEEPLPTLTNAKVMAREANGETTVGWAVLDASDRRTYERELLAGRRRAEEAERTASELSERLAATNQELVASLRELRESALYIRKLEGILPICMSCKSVRSDDDQEWVALDRYLMRTGAIALSHSICPSCSVGLEALE